MMAAYGLETRPANATLVIRHAPRVNAARRELLTDMPMFFWSQPLSSPPKIQPASAAKNGSHANSAMCLRSQPRTLFRYNGSQNESVPHIGSARKRGMAIPQKFRCEAIRKIDC